MKYRRLIQTLYATRKLIGGLESYVIFNDYKNKRQALRWLFAYIAKIRYTNNQVLDFEINLWEIVRSNEVIDPVVDPSAYQKIAAGAETEIKNVDGG